MASARPSPYLCWLLALASGACGPGSPADETGAGDGSGHATDTASSAVTLPTSGGTSLEPGDGASTSGPVASTSGGGSTGGEASTGDGSTGADCEDPRSPGCHACEVMMQPKRLLGLTWNFAEPGAEELRCIAPETGASGLVAAVPGLEGVASVHAHDREAAVADDIPGGQAARSERDWPIS